MDDDKVDLDLIAALIRHIVLEEEVGFSFLSPYSNDVTELWSVTVGNIGADSYFDLWYKEEFFLLLFWEVINSFKYLITL